MTFDLKAMEARAAELSNFDLATTLADREAALREAASALPSPLKDNLLKESEATQRMAEAIVEGIS